jgi:hypothetical protein
MKCSGIVCLVFIVLAAPSAAQPVAPSEPPSPPFLEKRVPEELAAEGVVLSRRNLGLTIEQLADRWLVSLVDLTTGRVVASTKVDVLPADREAAVAAMTHVVADLAAQVVGRAEPAPSAPPPAAPPASAPVDDRAERAQREVAELTFRRQSIRFSKVFLVGGGEIATGNRRNWTAYRGDLDAAMEPAEFYEQVGRPELVGSFRTRQVVKYVSMGVFVAGFTTSFALILGRTRKDCSSDLPFDEFEKCLDQPGPSAVPAYAALGVGTVGLYVWLWYALNPHPIRENEAKALADEYNQGLRGRLGLPVVARPPRIRDLKLTPYLGDRDAGVALTGRF